MAAQRVVLVTGASSGIGRATAGLLVCSGFRVYGTSRKPQTPILDGFRLLPLDVTDDDSVARCLAMVVAETGRLDALINNAGVDLPGALEEVDMELAHRLMETNLFGTARMTKAALPCLRVTKGYIVN